MQVGGGCKAEGNKGGKWDNCNSIINKIYLKIRKKRKIFTVFIEKKFMYQWFHTVKLCCSRVNCVCRLYSKLKRVRRD